MPTIRPPAVAGMFYPAEPTHRVAVRGLALPGADAFDTPLGRVMTGYGSNRQPQPSGASQRQRARARSTTALFANRTTRFQATPAGSRHSDCRRSCRGAGDAVGQRENADPDQLDKFSKAFGARRIPVVMAGTMTGEQLLRAHSPF